MKFAFALLAATAMVTPAFALDACKPMPLDAQTRTCVYEPGQRYEVNALLHHPVNFQFGPNERIKRFSPAYTSVVVDKEKGPVPSPSWIKPGAKGEQAIEADRFRNNLPLWPFDVGHSSIVITTVNDDGVERPYTFDTQTRKAASPEECKADGALPGCEKDAVTVAAMIFSYPGDVAAAAAKEKAEKQRTNALAWQVTQAKAKEVAAVARLKTDVYSGEINRAYQAQAKAEYQHLSPQVWDNGMLTAFKWPGNVPTPTITVVDPATGKPGVANAHASPTATTDGTVMVVTGTNKQYRLFWGADVVMDVLNKRWSPNRPDPGTGTTSPDVVRQVIQARK